MVNDRWPLTLRRRVESGISTASDSSLSVFCCRASSALTSAATFFERLLFGIIQAAAFSSLSAAARSVFARAASVIAVFWLMVP